MTIRVLDDRLINQIAAGEVVERPASVVKELVENSLDAGATFIEVSIEEGGQGSILVTDNGSGISAGEMELAFTRHATSKLADQSGLDNIDTLGFRGEALPSIASVAQVTMISSPDGIQGYKIQLAGGEVSFRGIHASPRGTVIEVKDLFYNVPARRKFLKTTVTESLQVYNVVFKLAAAHPEVAFTYQQNGRMLFKTPGNNQLSDTLAAVKGNSYVEGFLPVDTEGEYRVWGLISHPQHKRKNRREEIFLVNRRPVHSALLIRAIDQAYRGRLVTGEFPACYLHLEIPPSEVDVNVHPQKSEVRFRDEERVFRTVAGEVKRTLDKFNEQAWQGVPRYNPGYTSAKYPNYVPIAEAAASLYNTSLLNTAPDTEMVSIPYLVNQPSRPPGEAADFVLLGQIFDSYLLVAMGDKLLLIDQHAADESLRYQELLNNDQLWIPQQLLLPVSITVGKQRAAEFETIQEQLAGVGFSAETLGDDVLVLRAAPAIAKGQEEQLFNLLLEDLFTGEIGLDAKEFFRRAVASLACHQAVKANQRLNRLEMEILIKKLIAVPQAAHCPHGRPTYINIPQHRIAEWFKR